MDFWKDGRDGTLVDMFDRARVGQVESIGPTGRPVPMARARPWPAIDGNAGHVFFAPNGKCALATTASAIRAADRPISRRGPRACNCPALSILPPGRGGRDEHTTRTRRASDQDETSIRPVQPRPGLQTRPGRGWGGRAGGVRVGGRGAAWAAWAAWAPWAPNAPPSAANLQADAGWQQQAARWLAIDYGLGREVVCSVPRH